MGNKGHTNETAPLCKAVVIIRIIFVTTDHYTQQYGQVCAPLTGKYETGHWLQLSSLLGSLQL